MHADGHSCVDANEMIGISAWDVLFTLLFTTSPLSVVIKHGTCKHVWLHFKWGKSINIEAVALDMQAACLASIREVQDCTL